MSLDGNKMREAEGNLSENSDLFYLVTFNIKSRAFIRPFLYWFVTLKEYEKWYVAIDHAEGIFLSAGDYEPLNRFPPVIPFQKGVKANQKYFLSPLTL